MKKWTALLLACVMVLSLCACGKDDTKDPTDAPTATGGENNGDKDNSSETDDKTENEKVNASVFTEVLMTEKNFDGGTSTMKGLVEYDADYNIIGTKTYVDGKLCYEVTYHKDMNKPLVELTYSETGEIIDRTENTYDEKGNRVERVNAYSYDDETVTIKQVSTFDDNGNELTKKVYEDGELSYECRYTYTDDGKLEREAYINKDGDEESYTENTYDQQGNLLSVKVDGMLSGSYETYENIYQDGKLAEVKVYDQWELDGALVSHRKYDSGGNEVLVVMYDGETGEEWSRDESTYENGKLVKKVTYYEGKEEAVTLYTYNSDGKLTERSYTPAGENTQRRVYTYGNDGELTGVKAYDGDELISEYTMTFETVTVSKEVAQKIKENNDLLATF